MMRNKNCYFCFGSGIYNILDQDSGVILESKCPSCGGEVSHENVDWVGPLEASCGYCGGTIRATFERV